MKKLKFKISRNLKSVMLAFAIIGGTYAMAPTPTARVKAAFTIGLVSAFKKKGIKLDDNEEKTIKAIEEELEGSLTDALKGYLTPEQFQAKLDEQKENLLKGFQKDTIGEKSVEEILRAQGDMITEIKNAQKQQPSAEAMTIAKQIKSYIDANKDKFEAFKRGDTKAFGITIGKNGETEAGIEVKAAATMTVAGSLNGSAFVPAPEVVPGVVDLARNRPFIESYSATSGTSSPRVIWVEKYNPQGNADFIAEGGVKPLISIEFRTNESYAKKVADKIKVSTEMLDDVDFIAAEIDNELRYQVDIAVDEALLSGSGDGTSSATDLKGLTEYAGGYALSTIATTDPNNYDAIRAAIAQIVSMNFNPTHVFINPIDGANMDLVKDKNGRPLAMEYKDGNGNIYRLQPIETNQMPVGDILVGDMSRFKVRNYKSFAIYMGWVNDDFEKNLVTIIGERRLHCYVASNDTGAFIYDTFANIKTAITAVEAVNP